MTSNVNGTPSSQRMNAFPMMSAPYPDPARLMTWIMSMRLWAQLLQEAGQVLCMLFFLRKDPL